MSVNSTNPSLLFGGAWEQLKDRFLLGAGDSYTAGNTGGEATHYLTESEMPSHNHGYAMRAGSNGGWTIAQMSNGAGQYFGYTERTGGSQAHNNMPPYLVVYMWKRIA